MIGKIYKSIDDTLMYGANKAVQAWNWTTGKTKSDLASILEICGVAGVEIYLAKLDSFPSPYRQLSMSLFGILGITALFQNKDIEAKEHSALKQGYLDGEVEKFKRHTEMTGFMYFSSIPATVALAIAMREEQPTGSDTLTDVFGPVGYTLLAASRYIMRTGEFPKRKNCVSRAFKKLKKYAKQNMPQPLPLPNSACSALRGE